MNKKRVLIFYGVTGVVLAFLVVYIYIINKSKFLVIDKSLGNNIHSSNLEYSEIYNVSVQKKVEREVEKALKRSNTFKNPLIIYNCYGTNKLSVNVYFYDKKDLSFDYEISTANVNFRKSAYVDENSTLYSLQIVGLVSNIKNKVTIFSSDNRAYTFEINVPKYDMPITRAVESKDNVENLTDGFYTYLGMLQNDNNIDDIYLVDNNAIVRGIIPLKGNDYNLENNTADNIIFHANSMFYNIESDKIARVNRLGMVEDVYIFEGYNKHHDFTIDKENNKLLILASKNDSKTMEDIILIHDIDNKKITDVIDLKDIVSEIYSKADKNYTNSYSKDKIDWIHINSIDIKDNQLILSSRELSSIICLTDIYSNPKIKYILGDKEMYANTEYYDLAFQQKGNFSMHLGQHTAYFNKSSEYIAVYNNNYGISPITNWYNWNKHQNDEMGKNSFYYLYKVNNKDKTYELVEKIKVPYSMFMSSSQVIEDNKVVFSRETKTFAEYDGNNNLLRSFIVDRFSYRVNKYDFKGFWFN